MSVPGWCKMPCRYTNGRNGDNLPECDDAPITVGEMLTRMQGINTR
jgi:hypothetical protein